MEVQVRATKDQIEEFKSSILWADIVRELEMWKEGFRQELESIVTDAADTNPSTASVLLHMGSVDGRLKAVDYMIGLPDIFLSLIETTTGGEENE